MAYNKIARFDDIQAGISLHRKNVDNLCENHSTDRKFNCFSPPKCSRDEYNTR